MSHHTSKKAVSKYKRPAGTHHRLPAWFVLLICVVMLTLSFWIWLTRQSRSAKQDALTVTFQVDVNHADVMTLAGLPGLGMAMGQRIIDYRQTHGRFEQPGDLTRVSGIGNAKLLQLQPWIYCGPCVAATVPAVTPPVDSDANPSSDAKKSGSPIGELPLLESSTLPGDVQ